MYVNDDEAEDPYFEQELEGLVEAAQAETAGWARQRLDRPHRATYLGKGKVEEVQLAVAETGADGVIVDTELSGIQLRNLEEAVGKRVIDRTQLILDIFARRATTKEGQLQVELAQYSYRLPRLMSFYTKFERQRGGIGMRGPGETQLESDRRMIQNRIAHLEGDLEDVRKQRREMRSGRKRQPYPTAAIVGYTSAGKSTLMNRLSQTDLLADAMPFATLDPTTRKVELPGGYALYLTDTVGFIRNLPTHLVAAFRATLEEAIEADFLIHVVDASHPAWDLQRDSVLETLNDLGAGDQTMLTVFNKADLLEPGEAEAMVNSWPLSVAISATTGMGMDDLLSALSAQVQEYLRPVEVVLPYAENALLQECYEYGRVLAEEYRPEGIYVKAEVIGPLREKLMRSGSVSE